MNDIPELQEIENSSHLTGIQVQGKDLWVRFVGGEVYRYIGAGRHFIQVFQAESPGEALEEYVKGKYPYERWF